MSWHGNLIEEDDDKGINKHEKQPKSSVTVFISHASEDKQVAREIATQLREHGFITWLDIHSISPGDNLRAAIEKAISQADVVLVLVSRNSASSPWVTDEWSAIREHTWEHPDLKVLPILIENAPLPPFLREWQVMRFESTGAEKIAQRVAEIADNKSSLEFSRKSLSVKEMKEMGERFRLLRQVMQKEQAILKL